MRPAAISFVCGLLVPCLALALIARFHEPSAVRGCASSFDEALVRDELGFVLTMRDGEPHRVGAPHFSLPADGVVTSQYGWRRDPLGAGMRMHRGLDIANASLTTVRAAARGAVSFAGRRGDCGGMVVVDHGGGYQTWYCHLRRILVKRGEVVEGGQAIGGMGSTGRSTGSHLHFEVRRGKASFDPLQHLVVRRVGLSQAG